MVLVVFVIMLLNLGKEEGLKEKFNFRKILSIAAAGALVFQLLLVVAGLTEKNKSLPPFADEMGTAQSIGMELYTNYLLPFEAIAMLLMATIIGAVILAKKKIK